MQDMSKSKTSITALIVDDEYWARENMIDLFSDYEQVQIIGEAASVSEAREKINTLKPDAVFLDIQLRQGTGFDVLDGIEHVPDVVFVTAYDHFALRAFEVNALDYLLKPIDPARLGKSVQRLLAGQNKGFGSGTTKFSGTLELTDQILLCPERSLTMVRVDSIIWIRAARNYSEVMCVDQARLLKSRYSMKLWEERLGSLPFLRVDRSTIINTSLIKSLHNESGNQQLEFSNTDASLLLGRAAADNLKRHLLSIYPLS